MRFRERIGLSQVETTIQLEGMNQDLRNSLWNVLELHIFGKRDYLYNSMGGIGEIGSISKKIWFNLFKEPFDTIPNPPGAAQNVIREHYFGSEWYEAYEFIEFMVAIEESDELESDMNLILERELSGYRFISQQLAPVTEKAEIEEIESAANSIPYAAVSAHVKQALSHLSNRENPDYRNSIKESISAVEAMARIVSGNEKATLGDALAILEKNSNLHPALKRGFSALYGYASDEGGIRHAMTDSSVINVNDAKFFLVVCSAFVNYLKAKT